MPLTSNHVTLVVRFARSVWVNELREEKLQTSQEFPKFGDGMVMFCLITAHYQIIGIRPQLTLFLIGSYPIPSLFLLFFLMLLFLFISPSVFSRHYNRFHLPFPPLPASQDALLRGRVSSSSSPPPPPISASHGSS